MGGLDGGFGRAGDLDGGFGWGIWILDCGLGDLDGGFGFWMGDWGIWMGGFSPDYLPPFGFCIRYFLVTPTRVGGFFKWVETIMQLPLPTWLARVL